MVRISILILLMVSFLCVLHGDLTEEALFISNLHEDGYYDIALREIARIESRLENDRVSSQILLIKADILLKRNELAEAAEILHRLNSMMLTPALSSEVMLSLAKIAKSRNNLNEAFDLAHVFMSRFPNSQRLNEAQQLLGDVFLAQNLYVEAERVFLELHDEHQSEATFLNLIKIYVVLNQFDTAERYLNELRSTYPRSLLEYHYGLLHILNAYEHRGEFNRIIAVIPDNLGNRTVYTEPILFKQVVAHIRLGNFNEAEQLLSQVSDDTSSVNYYRAVIHKERGSYNLALPIFRALANSDAHPMIRAMSFFNMVQIISRTDTAEAYSLLVNFLIENPDQEWEGDILYQLAFIEFQNANYERAYDYIQRSLNFHLNDVNLRNAMYLKGEIEFLLRNYEGSINTFSQFLNLMPSELVDEALFKLGLNNYFLRRHELARQYFHSLLTEFPQSPKTGIAYYYMGEMMLFSDLNQARTYFRRALDGEMSTGVVNLRLAYVEYLSGEFAAALEILNRVPETREYMFDKHLLRGNVLFNRRNFDAALEAYRLAERNALDQVSVEFVWTKQALTLYNMRNYDMAMAIYRRLAEQSDTPGRFVLLAAGAAFNAENFEQAISLYEEYIETFPTSANIIRAQMGLANSFFNLAQYQPAISIWRELVHETQRPEVIESALTGLQTSYQRVNGLAFFSEFLHLSILTAQNRDFQLMMYEYKAFFDYEQRNFNESIATINQMFITFPEKQEDRRLMVLLANNYTWLNRFEEADRIYIDLSTRYNDPFIFHEWGHIKWAQGDYRAALIRFKRAADNSQNEQYWLTLLEKMVERNDDEFMRYYEQFITFASAYHRNLAMLYLVENLINLGDLHTAYDRTGDILAANFPQLRGRATFKRGEIQFLQNNFQDALTNFLRVRYIFNEFSELRWTAEFFICKIYLAQGERERAINLFNSIQNRLSREQIAEFNGLL